MGQIVNLRRIVYPPARCAASQPALAALPAKCDRRIANPPQVNNLPHILVWLLTATLAYGATRPRFGGTLRVEIRAAIETPDPPVAGHGIPDVAAAFNIARWEAGRRAVYDANENAPAGRPYLDSIDIQMGKTLHDQSIDLELGRADIVELGPGELLRQSAGRRVWSSAPVRVIALLFSARIEDARIREALALAVDRPAIHSVLMQRQGEISGALLPQWISGYAFVFPTASDAARARALVAGLPQGQRTLSLGVEDAAARPIAERIALNARYAGLAVSVIPQAANADVRLVEVRVASADPARALASVALALGLPEPPHADSAEALEAAERVLLAGFRVVPLIHLPDVYGVSPRVKGGPGITPLGEWRFENLWVTESRAGDAGRP
ncbi:MAG TPA: ABC transporter substrate-binding protein [Candidatus Solibacter sp.]|nr:ABC transporter substrate-binding protein [Candidatus Solibacter sp.]